MVSQATDSLCIAPFCFPSAPLSPTWNPTCRHATSIWFDFMEMFILLSKYPFIALGMELDVLLDWAGQITTGKGKLLLCPKVEKKTRLKFCGTYKSWTQVGNRGLATQACWSQCDNVRHQNATSPRQMKNPKATMVRWNVFQIFNINCTILGVNNDISEDQLSK